jgi:hypothetical protein
MNDVTTNDVVPTDGIEVKHYALAIDADGNEVQIEIPAEAVGYVQDAEEEAKPTVH